jgi:hypothetical protein
MMAFSNSTWITSAGTAVTPFGAAQTYNSAQGYRHKPAYEIMMKVPFAASETPAPEVLMTQVKLAIASATEKFEQDGGSALRFVAQHISDHCDAFTKDEYGELTKLVRAPYDAQAQGRAAETFVRINMGETPENSEQKNIREKQEYEMRARQTMMPKHQSLGEMYEEYYEKQKQANIAAQQPTQQNQGLLDALVNKVRNF